MRGGGRKVVGGDEGRRGWKNAVDCLLVYERYRKDEFKWQASDLRLESRDMDNW